MRLRPIIAHALADFVLAELANHRRTDDETDQQGGQDAQDAPKGQVLEDTETFQVIGQPIGQT